MKGINTMNLLEKKKEIAQAVRTLSGGGILTLMVGHVSFRDKESGNIVILGHAHKEHKTLDQITEDDIILMDKSGKTIEGKYEPPGELFIHTEIYKARPDVMAIVHGHPEYCIACSIDRKPMFPVYYRAAQFFPDVPVLDYAGQIDTEEKGKSTADAIQDRKGLMLRGHGIVTVGATVEEAAVNAFALETNARIMLYASMKGTPEPLRQDDLKIHKPTSEWVYYTKKYDNKSNA